MDHPDNAETLPVAADTLADELASPTIPSSAPESTLLAICDDKVSEEQLGTFKMFPHQPAVRFPLLVSIFCF